MTFSLACCLIEYEIIFSLYKFTVGAGIKIKDSFPYCINNFMQVSDEGRLGWTSSCSSKHLEFCSFYLLNYFVLPKNISSFNSVTNTPDGLCHSLSLCFDDHTDNNPWTAIILAVGIFQHLRVTRNQRNCIGKVFRKLSSQYPSSEAGSGASLFLEHVKITYP